MNTPLQLTHPATILDRIAFFLTRSSARAKALRTTHLEDIRYRLMVKAMALPAKATAHAFRPILEQAARVSPNEWASLAREGDGRRVLVDNEYLKVVLIRWEPGAASDRHYHPKGGGMITVLEGAIQETRYLNDRAAEPYETRTLARHTMSYIDDTLGAHVVANPHEKSATTLHAYLKYRNT